MPKLELFLIAQASGQGLGYSWQGKRIGDKETIRRLCQSRRCATGEVSIKPVFDTSNGPALKFQSARVDRVPGIAARQPRLCLRLEAGWIIQTSDLYYCDSGHFWPICRYRRAAFCAEAAAQSSTATADHFMISRFFFQELEFVSGDHHHGCESATAGALTVTTMTDQLYYWFFSTFIPNALTGAASRKQHWNLSLLCGTRSPARNRWAALHSKCRYSARSLASI